MSPKPGQTITRHFASVQDPRIDRTKLHSLEAILVIAICAIIYLPPIDLLAKRPTKSKTRGKSGNKKKKRGWLAGLFCTGYLP